MKSSSFKIDGMTCSACANRVERVVKKMDGEGWIFCEKRYEKLYL